MKIHSKFNDYYDSAMAYGVDDHVHWVRKTSKIQIGGPDPAKAMLGNNCNKVKVDHIPSHEFLGSDMCKERPSGTSGIRFGRRTFRHANTSPDYENFFIGFCGRIYLGIKFSWDDSRTGMDEPTIRFAYNVADIIKILNEFDKKHKTTNAKNFIEDKDVSASWSDLTRFNERGMAAYYKKFMNAENIQYFVELNTPAFIVNNLGGYAEIVLNPVLKDYGFQSVMDPYTAYQEIEMFMGGVLAELDEIDVPGVSDESLKTGKGFDKWSFKTMPTKKR